MAKHRPAHRRQPRLLQKVNQGSRSHRSVARQKVHNQSDENQHQGEPDDSNDDAQTQESGCDGKAHHHMTSLPHH